MRRVVGPSPSSVALGLLALAAATLWAGQRPSQVLRATSPVPEQLGLWTGTPIPVTDRAKAILETDDVALMEYRLGEEPPVWFAQVAGFGNRAAFHPPELCYVGSHFEVLERGAVTVMVNGQPRQVMRLVLGQGGHRFEAWYWFTANGRITPNYYQQQVWLLRALIARRPASGTLVRVSTPVDEASHSHRRLLAFMASWEGRQGPGVTHGS